MSEQHYHPKTYSVRNSVGYLIKRAYALIYEKLPKRTKAVLAMPEKERTKLIRERKKLLKDREKGKKGRSSK